MGFEEIAHTADLAMRVWADDLEGLFVEAARGMYAITGSMPAPDMHARMETKPASGAAKKAGGPKVNRIFKTEAPDAESLLVTFLSELVYTAEQEHLIFDEFEVFLKGPKLRVELCGSPILSFTKAIKGVTYHNLEIQRTIRGYEVEIVFDV